MKLIRSLLPLLGILMTPQPTANGDPGELLEPLRPAVQRALSESYKLPSTRQDLLDDAARQIVNAIRELGGCDLIFVCTHNSRRSHLSHVWADVAAASLGLPEIGTASGGTETTACNPRTVQSLRRLGFSVVRSTFSENPIYLVQSRENAPPVRVYSKAFHDPENPQQNFFAMMCCSDADEECPLIPGSLGRVALHYEDPKVSDNTPEEGEVYDTRSRQIASEMFYLMRRVKEMRAE
ncbi:MAG: hypothetical protein KDA80_18295 [Planctomycetaceae bacterium]|nr:hypothetical protein [Planctomycetaceae bacterium]